MNPPLPSSWRQLVEPSLSISSFKYCFPTLSAFYLLSAFHLIQTWNQWDLPNWWDPALNWWDPALNWWDLALNWWDTAWKEKNYVTWQELNPRQPVLWSSAQDYSATRAPLYLFFLFPFPFLYLSFFIFFLYTFFFENFLTLLFV